MHLKSGLLLATAALCVAAGPLRGDQKQPLYKAQLIFPTNEANHVHASSIVECPNGDLRAVWYENGPELPSPPFLRGERDKSDDVRIGGSRMARGADVWEAPFVMSDTFGTSDNNPAVVIDHKGKLWLFHSTMLGAPDWSWGSSIVRYRIASNYDHAGPPVWERSELLIPRPGGFDTLLDELEQRIALASASEFGSESRKAVARVYLGRMRELAKEPIRLRLGWMPRAHPLIRSDGTLILPLSNENFSIPVMAMTSDDGQTWTLSRAVPEAGLIQPSLAERPDGTIVAYFRNGDPRRRIKRSESTDGGMTWSVPELTDRLHPGGGVEILQLKSGKLALVYNNKEQKPRDKLAISLSDDGGRSWKWTRQLEDTAGGRFDYPSIVQARDGSLHVTYSYHLKSIKHVQLNEAWIQQSAEEPPAAADD